MKHKNPAPQTRGIDVIVWCHNIHSKRQTEHPRGCRPARWGGSGCPPHLWGQSPPPLRAASLAASKDLEITPLNSKDSHE